MPIAGSPEHAVRPITANMSKIEVEMVRFFIIFSLSQLFVTTCIIRPAVVFDFIGRISEPYG
jgi:hypothetical protein